jgi:hypothetical protein
LNPFLAFDALHRFWLTRAAIERGEVHSTFRSAVWGAGGRLHGCAARERQPP